MGFTSNCLFLFDCLWRKYCGVFWVFLKILFKRRGYQYRFEKVQPIVVSVEIWYACVCLHMRKMFNKRNNKNLEFYKVLLGQESFHVSCRDK